MKEKYIKIVTVKSLLDSFTRIWMVCNISHPDQKLKPSKPLPTCHFRITTYMDQLRGTAILCKKGKQ